VRGAGEWVAEDSGTLIAVQDATLFQPEPADASRDFGLGRLLGISKQSLPNEMKTTIAGKGHATYLPRLLPANQMAVLIERHLGATEAVKVEPRTAVLSSAYAQTEGRADRVHLLNYRQDRQQGIKIEVRAPVARAAIISPDRLQRAQPIIHRKGTSSEIVVPELYTYDVVAIYPEREAH